MDMIVKGGEIITDCDSYTADIGIEGGKIRLIQQDLPVKSSSEVIDADGKLVMPGFIDAHVHLSLPVKGTVTVETFETGTRAAAAGGVTTIIDFAVPAKGVSLKEEIGKRMALAQGDAGRHPVKASGGRPLGQGRYCPGVQGREPIPGGFVGCRGFRL